MLTLRNHRHFELSELFLPRHPTSRPPDTHPGFREVHDLTLYTECGTCLGNSRLSTAQGVHLTVIFSSRPNKVQRILKPDKSYTNQHIFVWAILDSLVAEHEPSRFYTLHPSFLQVFYGDNTRWALSRSICTKLREWMFLKLRVSIYHQEPFAVKKFW